MPATAMQPSVPTDQQHLLAHWDQLSAAEQQELASQLESVDYALMAKLFAGEDKTVDWSALASQATAPDAFRLNDDNNRFSKEQAVAAGREALAAGKVGVILVAGGQGSRLGFDLPKSMYPIGPLSNRTLLQIHIEKIRAVAKRYQVSVPLYLMTSPATHQATVEFLRENDRFGFPESDLHVFCQGMMPAVDAKTGELLLAEKGKLFQSPDGHGGTLLALEKSGCVADIAQRGVEHLFYFQVDNPLVEICDPELIGYHVLSNSELTTQVVAKQDPMEKVGNVATVDGKMMIIEYSDLPESQADRRGEDGNPVFWAGNIAVHVFGSDFVSRSATDSESLPFHRASKKVPFVNADGEQVTPTEPNAIKFEKFIFDLLPLAQNPIVVEAEERLVFAPLKNASGAPKDTPEYVRDAIVAKHAGMLEAAGVTVKPGVQVEINPLFAMDADELKTKVADSLLIETDQYFEA